MDSCYARYTDEAHAEVAQRIIPPADVLIVRPTFSEASDAALVGVFKALVGAREARPIKVYYHPHSEVSQDPLDFIGSWGWKTVG